MKIVIDGRMIGWTGIGRYSRKLIEQLQQIDHDNHYTVLLLPQDMERLQLTAANFSKQVADYRPYSWSEQKLGRLLDELKPDLVHFTSFNLPRDYSGKYVVTIHDLTLIKFQNVRGGMLAWLKYQPKYWFMRRLLRAEELQAAKIIAPTKTVAAEIAARYPAAKDKLAVTYEAADKTEVKPAGLEQLGVGSDFLLYVGNAYPYKNLGRLVEAFALVAKDRPELELVVVGGSGSDDHFWSQVRGWVAELGLASRIRFTGFISGGQLAALYSQAKLFVFPSLSEGFGLPGLEAMAMGTPVAASRASCLPEVYGAAAAYFDPLDPADMARVMASVLDDPSRQDALRRAGQAQVKKYSWRKMAEETLAVYKELAP